jgi:hypothetical protein
MKSSIRDFFTNIAAITLNGTKKDMDRTATGRQLAFW